MRQLSLVETMERHGSVRDPSPDALPVDGYARARRLHRMPSAQRREAMDDRSDRLLRLPRRGLPRSEHSSEPSRHRHVRTVSAGLLPVSSRECLEPRVHRPDGLHGFVDELRPSKARRDGRACESRHAFSGITRSAPWRSLQQLPHVCEGASPRSLCRLPCAQPGQAAESARTADIKQR